MALFKIFKGSKDDLGITSGTDKAYDGYAYFTPDNGKFYIDVIPPGGNDGDPANPGVNRIPLSADKADNDVLGHAIEQTYVADVDIINGTVGLYGGDGSLIKTIQIPTSLQEKTFTNVIGTANNNANAAFYFGKILPTSYYETWRIEYRVSSITAGRNDARSYHHVILTGTQGNLISYANFNTIANTSYRSIYYHELYRAKEAGITNGYGHLLGVGLHNAWNPTTAANSRTITVEIDRCVNCTFTFFDNVIKYASAPGTGSTNYNAVSELDAYTNGLRETSDDNTITQNRIGYTSSVAAETIYRYQVLLRTKDRKLLPVSSANNTVGTTARTYTTTPFDPFSEIYYYNSTSTVNANANVGSDTLYRQILADLRYSFGVNNSATYRLVARQPVYLTATLQNDGTAILTVPTGNEDIGPLVQTLPSEEDGLIYIYLGQAYEDTNPYRLELTMNSHPIYMYKNGQIRQYSQYAGGVHWSNVLDKPSTFTPSSHSHGNITNAGELSTATRAVVTDANKKITISSVTSTELGYLSGVTSAIQTQLNAKAPLASPALTGTPTAPTAAAGTNTTQIATTAFVTNAVAQGFVANDAMVFKGLIGSNQTITQLPTSGYNAGWTYRVADAGIFAGEYCEVGDLLIAINDGPTSGSSVINADWGKVEHNIDGAVFRGSGASNSSVGSSTQPVYVNASGIVTAITGAIANDTTGNAATATVASKLSNTSKIGDTNKPVYFKADGTPAAINYTIDKSVPSNAVFTDTTYTFADGTNGFTVTPSGGTAQTVTVTPSIANNITGSGTSGYLTKFNGTNTITNGPQLSSAISSQSQTTKFLREDGTWAAPSYTINTNTTYTFADGTNGNFTVTPSGGSAQTVSIGKPAAAGTADAVAWSGITGKPSTFTPSSHTHGNITNAGELTTASQAVVTDANKKITTKDLSVSSATNSNDTATRFVSSVTQDAQGQISVTTKPLPTYNNYSLPVAANGTLGGIQIGYNSSGKNYAVQLDNEKAYVNVPWTDTTYESKAAENNGTAVSLVTTGEKYTWNNKQNALSIQTAYASKGTSTKVAQITTNTLGQVTSITEVDIAFPTKSSWNYDDTYVKYSASQSLTDNQKTQARTNIGAGTSSLTLGTTSTTAYRGDYGNSAYTHAVTNKGSAFASGLYKITTNSEGHVTAATAVSAGDITGLDVYWANVKTDASATYNTEPEVKSIKIGNGTTATATKSVQLVYDSALEVLNFVFA